MAREVELFDGTVLEFPDGTADEVLDRTARRETDRLRTEQARRPLPQDIKPNTTVDSREIGRAHV